jgi:hypothetical protein
MRIRTNKKEIINHREPSELKGKATSVFSFLDIYIYAKLKLKKEFFIFL